MRWKNRLNMNGFRKYDYLIAGSGLFGATFAHMARKRGKRCLVLERRDHLGGNVYCENVEGINVHRYGAHIFHTSDKAVWDFVCGLVEMNRYTNSPIAVYGDELYNLPFNMNTFSKMWGVRTPAEAQAKIEEQRVEAVAALGGREPSNLEEQALTLVGRDIFEKLIKEYTEKQWGRSCKELPAFIIRRLPVRLTYDNNYFNDLYQGIPIGGYNRLIERLLEGTECLTSVDFLRSEWRDSWREKADMLVYTGAIDEYFDCALGRLDWRTVKFETETLDIPNYQGNAVVNYTSHEAPWTRIIEHKHFEMFGQQVYDCPKTVVSREYSVEYSPGMEPYYPVNDERNSELYARYKALADNEKGVIFGGRLGEYKYYDMAPTIARAMAAERETAEQ